MSEYGSTLINMMRTIGSDTIVRHCDKFIKLGADPSELVEEYLDYSVISDRYKYNNKELINTNTNPYLLLILGENHAMLQPGVNLGLAAKIIQDKSKVYAEMPKDRNEWRDWDYNFGREIANEVASRNFEQLVEAGVDPADLATLVLTRSNMTDSMGQRSDRGGDYAEKHLERLIELGVNPQYLCDLTANDPEAFDMFFGRFVELGVSVKDLADRLDWDGYYHHASELIQAGIDPTMVAEHLWGETIEERFDELLNAGCDINVLLSRSNGGTIERHLKKFVQHGIDPATFLNDDNLRKLSRDLFPDSALYKALLDTGINKTFLDRIVQECVEREAMRQEMWGGSYEESGVTGVV